MSGMRKSPAVFAGLIGTVAFSLPLPAYALSLPFSFEDFANSPAVYFVLGCVAGAAVSGSIVYAVLKHSKNVLRDRLTRQLEEALQTQDASSATTSLEGVAPAVAAEPAAVGEDAYGVAASNPAERPEVPAPEGAEGNQPLVRTGIVELGATSPHVSLEIDRRLPHISVADFGEPVPLALPSLGEALAAGTEPASAAQGASTGSEGLATSSAPSSRPVREQASASQDLGSTYAQREANRKRGVRSLLTERLGSNMMADLPVITRADGTVADIGTDWWNETMGNTIAHVSNDGEAEQLGLRPADETTDLEAAALANDRLSRQQRARAIADRLPDFDKPLYPEAPSTHADDTGEEDLFEQAMRNMDDELPNQSVMTSPDEELTQAVPAEALGNFSNAPLGSNAAPDGAAPVEQEDSAALDSSHVDELLREELERRNDTPDRRRRSWHVVDGGMPAPSPESTASLAGGSYRPRHMKAAVRKQA